MAHCRHPLQSAQSVYPCCANPRGIQSEQNDRRNIARTGLRVTSSNTDRAVEAFVKNAVLGFAIPYLYNGQSHDYVPDFVIRLQGQPGALLILETQGYDPLAHIKMQAAQR